MGSRKKVDPLATTDPEPTPEPAAEGAPAVGQLEMRSIPIDFVIPNPWNTNVMDDITFNRLQDEIAEVGMIDPVQVVPNEDDYYVIIGGEHRWRACKNLGHTEIPCVVLSDAKWKDQDLQKFVTVRLNILHGKTDPDKFVALYNEMVSKYGADSLQHLMGYTDSQAFQKMLGWVKKGLKQSLPKEMASQVDAATKDVKTMADLSRIIQDMFNKYGETVDKSFMVFTYGKQTHIYVQMDAKMRRAMDKVMECLRFLGQDINQFMTPVMEEMVKKAAKEIESKKAADALNPPADVAPEKSQW